MIPIRDHTPTETVPFVTYILLAINVAVFAFMFMMPEGQLMEFVETNALIPAEIVRGVDLYTLVTSMFMHGGLGHIFSNMLFLHIFGDNLEDHLGHIRYLAFYLLAGLGASALQIVTGPGSEIPNLGASGAIAGLLGGYLLLFPNHKIDMLVPFGGWLHTITVPASMMLLYWFVGQLISGVGTLGVDGGGIAYFAHIGGFIAGALLIKILPPRSARRSAFFEV